jgi:replicative DNA helicase
MSADLLIPQNPAAERAALGTMLFGASPYAVPIRVEHFADPAHQLVFRSVAELAGQGLEVGVPTVTTHLTASGQLAHAGGPGAVTALLASTTGNKVVTLRYYFDQLEDVRQVREVYLAVNAALPELVANRLSPSAFIEDLQARVTPVNTSTGKTAAEIVEEMEKEMMDGPAEKFATGLKPLDLHLGGGISRQEVFVVGGQTSRGKSALLVQAAAAALDAGRPVVYFTLELPRKTILKRVAACRSGIHPKHPNFRHALCDAIGLPLVVNDQLGTLEEITAAIRGAARYSKTAVFVVDYLQKVDADADNRELQVAAVSRRLKTLAMQENVAIFTASQLNDDGRLRESRTIGHDADVVVIINEDELFVDKFRNGERNVNLPARLDGPCSRFVTV